MSTELGVEITIHRLCPPLGGRYHYAAKIRPVQSSENGASVRFRLPFDEAWGESEDEARQKAAAMVSRLIGRVSVREISAEEGSDGQESTENQQVVRSEGAVGAAVATGDTAIGSPVADPVSHALAGQPA